MPSISKLIRNHLHSKIFNISVSLLRFLLSPINPIDICCCIFLISFTFALSCGGDFLSGFSDLLLLLFMLMLLFMLLSFLLLDHSFLFLFFMFVFLLFLLFCCCVSWSCSSWKCCFFRFFASCCCFWGSCCVHSNQAVSQRIYTFSLSFFQLLSQFLQVEFFCFLSASRLACSLSPSCVVSLFLVLSPAFVALKFATALSSLLIVAVVYGAYISFICCFALSCFQSRYSWIFLGSSEKLLIPCTSNSLCSARSNMSIAVGLREIIYHTNTTQRNTYKYNYDITSHRFFF